MFDKAKTIVIGADHFGLALKNIVRDHLVRRGYTVKDMGVHSDAAVDYPDIGAPVAEEIRKGTYERGILVCGTGAGMAIVANKVPGIRAVCINDPYTAERAVASNDAQIVTLGSQVVGPGAAEKLIDIWLDSEFQGGRSAAKVDKITRMDKACRGG